MLADKKPTTDAELSAAIAPLATVAYVGANFAPISHNHSADHITSGALAKARQHAQTAYKDEANTFSQDQTFNGNVGIKTSTPQRSLGIGGTTNAYLNFNPSSSRQYTIGSDDSGFVVFDDTGGAYRLQISSTGDIQQNGSLGIGTAPSVKLDVLAGDVYRVLRVATSTAGLIEIGTLGQSTVGIQSLTNAGSFQNFVMQPNGGSLSIGTSVAPSTKFHVEGTSSFGGSVRGKFDHEPITKTALLATTPTATLGVHRLTDSTPAQRRVYPDGTNWRYYSDDSIVS